MQTKKIHLCTGLIGEGIDVGELLLPKLAEFISGFQVEFFPLAGAAGAIDALVLAANRAISESLKKAGITVKPVCCHASMCCSVNLCFNSIARQKQTLMIA